jgi:multifunctional beta-oxidation protein
MSEFKEKVVVVTGAGGGLGKAYALLFASLGAKVVVNDFGTALSGEGQTTTKAADLVVKEIVSAGGSAVSNYDSVENGKQIIETAIKNYGRIDILINNAGILRDKSFAKMQEKDWELVMNVHLHGSYSCTAAAWPYMLKQGFGRIVNTTSAAGLYGNFGQSNYSAAKLALYGFTKSLAKEGERKNVFSNAIAPIAGSRMTETVMPAELVEALSPNYIAPFVAYLCSSKCSENGSCYELGGGFIAKLRLERSPGLLMNTQENFNAANILQRFSEISNYQENVAHPQSMAEVDWVGLVERSRTLPPNPSSSIDVGLRKKVVLITGSGAGLGKAHALQFAKEGAIVIINDINPETAEATAKEISKLFGIETFATCDNVLDADSLIQKIVAKYSRIDVVVNNAGILRDKSFAKMTPSQWKQVYEIHLLATWRICKAAWPHMQKQGFGRIINTSSAVGLYGNFGQANYSSAKAGIWGLSNCLALEGAKYNIKVNTIAPNAGTAMTATILDDKTVEILSPSFVSPLVTLLGSEKCPCNGAVIEVGSGWHAAVRWQRSKGEFYESFDLPSIDSRWNQAISFAPSSFPSSVNDTLSLIINHLESKMKEQKEAASFTWTSKDVILYHLGLDYSVDKEEDFKYLYENADAFCVLPTFGVIPALDYMLGKINFDSILEGYNPALLLHGEHAIKIHRPLPTNPHPSAIESTASIVEMQEKQGKGTVVRVLVDSFLQTENGQKSLLFQNEGVLFIRGACPKKKIALKKTLFEPAVKMIALPTSSTQVTIPTGLASIYRLSGDANPLHIDPQIAKAAGFPKPILHGMCSFGICAKQLVKLFCRNSPERMIQIQARFTKPVFPGQQLRIEACKVVGAGGGLVAFQAFAKGQGTASGKEEMVISNGIFQFDPEARL